MTRLTNRDEFGNADIIGVDMTIFLELPFDEFNLVTRAINKLAYYEENEPKKGKWIKTNDYVTCAYGCMDYVKCSCCKNDSLEEGDYCPSCGAKMEAADGD